MHPGFSLWRLPPPLALLLTLTAMMVTLGCAPRSGPGIATSADGIKISYTVREAANDQGKPALVFIHGWLCDQSFWSQQENTFATNHKVVTLDLAGHGRSGGKRSAWTLEAFGQDVQAVIKDMGLSSVILIGHSLGGPVALEATRLLPNEVVGVIGVDAFHNADQQMDPKQLEGFLQMYKADFTGTCKSFVNSMYLEDADTDLVERTIAGMCSAKPEVAIAQMREFSTYDLSLGLRQVTAPIRTVNASRFPTQVEGNQQYAPTFDAKLMDGVGHFLMMERPAEFNELLAEWIADLENRLVTIDP